MKSLIMSVLAGLLTCFSVVFAEEILVGTNGEVVVKSEPWRPATAEEVKAYKTGEEIPVWSSFYRTNVSFFRGGLVRVSTNSLVYRDGRIHPVARSTAKVETIFLWYKVLMGVAIAMMVSSNFLLKRRKYDGFPAFAFAAFAFAFSAVAAAAVVAAVVAVVAAVAVVFVFAAAAVAVAVAAFVFDYNKCEGDRKAYTISSALFYLMAILAMVV